MKLYVLIDSNGYVTDYIFRNSPLQGWIETKETKVNEQTPFSKLVDGYFVLDEYKWNEYQELVNPTKED